MSIAEKLQTVAENQQKVYDGGFAAGQAQNGYDDGILAGKQAEYDRFWDAYQNNGTLNNYYQAFQNAFWDDDTFRPKYPITCSGGSTNARSICYNATNITNIPVDVIVTGISMQDAFSRCGKLHAIKKLVLNGVTSLVNTFTGCSALENIEIDGSIDVNFNISATAVLTDASVQSIIDHLKDLIGATAQTLTFHATVGGNLSNAQKATITAKNWTLVY